MNTPLIFTQGPLSRLADVTTSVYPISPKAKITFLNGTTVTVPEIQEGTIYFAKDENSQNKKVYIYLDADGERYIAAGPVAWDDIYDIPKDSILKDVQFLDTPSGSDSTLNDSNGYYKRLELTALDNSIKITRLPFLYANKADTLTAPLTLGGGGENGKGDSDTAGKIILNPADGSQMTDSGTSTLFGFIGDQSSAKNLTVGHSSYNLQLRSKNDNSNKRYSYGPSNASIEVYGPKVTVSDGTNTQVIAYVDDIIPKAYGDDQGNKIANTYVALEKITLDANNPYKLYFYTSQNKEKDITTTDYYLGSLSGWTSNTSNHTLDINFNYYKNGAADGNQLTLQIPAASEGTYGIVTTGEQNFGGLKTFAAIHAGEAGAETNDLRASIHGAIGLGANEQVKIYFNHSAESIDFSFN